MITMLELVLLFVAGFLGILFSAFAGYVQSDDSFEPKKFASSILTGIGVVMALIITALAGNDEVTTLTYILFFSSTAGFETMAKRVAKSVT